MEAGPVNLLGLMVDSAMATLIWLVQRIIYPGFADIPRARFHEWHKSYMKAISAIVMPLMLGQAAFITYGLMTDFSWWVAAAAGCMVVAWVVTFTLSVPCHTALQERGNESALVNRLVHTNWLRTIAWTAMPFLRLNALL